MRNHHKSTLLAILVFTLFHGTAHATPSVWNFGGLGGVPSGTILGPAKPQLDPAGPPRNPNPIFCYFTALKIGLDGEFARAQIKINGANEWYLDYANARGTVSCEGYAAFYNAGNIVTEGFIAHYSSTPMVPTTIPAPMFQAPDFCPLTGVSNFGFSPTGTVAASVAQVGTPADDSALIGNGVTAESWCSTKWSGLPFFKYALINHTNIDINGTDLIHVSEGICWLDQINGGTPDTLIERGSLKYRLHGTTGRATCVRYDQSL